jgi:DNA-binding NarL/FixJ family response regulator
LNGLDTLDRLIARDPGVKVVMISAERSGAWRHAALDRGASAVLGKPFSPADIDRELHSIFGLRLPGLADVPPLKLAATEAIASAINENTWVNAAEAPHSPRRFSNADKWPGRSLPAGAGSSDW